ncbi:MAG: phosphoesterase [Bryobacterales bacterium]|nr:phosphoesterase [Bryobacteraceae bacterium]MDW8128984.1 phosphoesterase [Bryobacterales bacterium]
MRVRILYHDHCFDGAAAAAYFSRFLEERFHPDAEFLFTGLAHKADQIFEEWMFDGDVNAIVDFKYSPDPRLTWWFDHHQSAFLTPEDAEQYRRNPSERKLYDPDAPSCTGFIARVARERWGWEAPDLAELVRWAEIIDGAQYPDARTAVEMPAAAMKLTLVIEGVKGSETVQQIIRWMRRRPLDEIIEEPGIQRLFAPLFERHLSSIEIIRSRARCADGVVSFDLIGYDLEGYNKFIPYYLFPEAVYSVSVSTSSFRTKVSVGSNPWAPRPPRHNLASICERYGGGGHARVGAISFPLGEYEQARKVAEEIAAELRREAQ